MPNIEILTLEQYLESDQYDIDRQIEECVNALKEALKTDDNVDKSFQLISAQGSDAHQGKELDLGEMNSSGTEDIEAEWHVIPTDMLDDYMQKADANPDMTRQQLAAELDMRIVVVDAFAVASYEADDWTQTRPDVTSWNEGPEPAEYDRDTPEYDLSDLGLTIGFIDGEQVQLDLTDEVVSMLSEEEVEQAYTVMEDNVIVSE